MDENDDGLHAETEGAFIEARDPYRVWWRTLRDRHPTLEPDAPVDVRQAIQHYRYLHARHLELGFICSGLHLQQVPKPDPGVIRSGAPIYTQKCRVATCPACWHRRQADIGRLVAETEAAHWYVAYTNAVPAGERVHEKVLARLRRDQPHFTTLAWTVAPVVDFDESVPGVGYLHVLISVATKRIESNNPIVKHDGVAVGSVVRQYFSTREKAYDRWVELNPHPGSVLTHDDACVQAALIDFNNPKKGFVKQLV